MNDIGTHSYLSDTRNEKIKIYINGKTYIRSEAKISVFDSGFLLGDGVWEGIRLLNGQLVFLNNHLDRLYNGAEKLRIDVNMTKDELSKLIYKNLSVNNMHTGVHIRIIISRGMKKTPYQHPNANTGGCSIVIIPEYKEADKNVNKKGLHLVLVETRRGTNLNQDPRLNTLSKLNCILACIEADELGANEGIMLDINGNVSTCNSTNLFIVNKDEVWTSTGEYCLPGITRQSVIDLCRENNFIIKEKNFTINELYRADEVFVTGTFAGIIPATKIDNQIVSKGSRGELTKKLQILYENKLNKLYPIIK